MVPAQERENFPLLITFWHSGKKYVTAKKIRYDANEVKLKGLVKDLEQLYFRLILCSKNIGSWLTAQDTTVTGTLLAAT